MLLLDIVLSQKISTDSVNPDDKSNSSGCTLSKCFIMGSSTDFIPIQTGAILCWNLGTNQQNVQLTQLKSLKRSGKYK